MPRWHPWAWVLWGMFLAGLAGAAVLLVVHAPRAQLLGSSVATPVAGGS